MVENLLLTAADLGLGGVYLMGCVRALQDRNDLQAEMNIPDGFMPMAGMAVGVPAGELPAHEIRVTSAQFVAEAGQLLLRIQADHRLAALQQIADEQLE